MVRVSGFEKITLASIPSPVTNLKWDERVVKRLASWLHKVRKGLRCNLDSPTLRVLVMD